MNTLEAALKHYPVPNFAPESQNSELKGKKLLAYCAHKIGNGVPLTASEANAVHWFIADKIED